MFDIVMPLFNKELYDASAFVRTMQQRQGIKVMSPEEIAFDLGYISAEELLAAADRAGNSDYAVFLRRRAAEGRNPPQPLQ
jgi:glucose-1-phosphate thymidylyltransferase